MVGLLPSYLKHRTKSPLIFQDTPCASWEYIGATCDNCGVTFEENFTGISFFTDNEYLHPEEQGWHVDGDTHYCSNCHTIDDEDNLQVKPLPPVFVVIADFPDNKDFPMGKVIEFEPWNSSYWQHKITDCQGERIKLSDWFEKYPHLFKKVFASQLKTAFY